MEGRRTPQLKLSTDSPSRLSSSYSRKSKSRMYMPNFCSVSVVSCLLCSVDRSLPGLNSSHILYVREALSSFNSKMDKTSWTYNKPIGHTVDFVLTCKPNCLIFRYILCLITNIFSFKSDYCMSRK